MTKWERIRQLEARIAEYEARIAEYERVEPLRFSKRDALDPRLVREMLDRAQRR